MHLLTIVFGPAPTLWALLFEKPELADKALLDLVTVKKENSGVIDLADEYGQRAVLEVPEIHGFMLEDMNRSQVANVERQMHHERFIAKVKQQASADPAIRAAHAGQGPAILQPMGNGRLG
jgi:hypothetical protein